MIPVPSIHTLPVELVCRIFAIRCHPVTELFKIDDLEAATKDINSRALVLSEVCRDWNTIAMSVPSLWTTIAIYSEPYSEEAGLISWSFVELTLKRSKNLPLYVHIASWSEHLGFRPFVSHLRTALASHNDRIHLLHVYGAPQPFTPPYSNKHGPYALPKLRKFGVRGEWDNAVDTILDDYALPVNLLTACTDLREIKLFSLPLEGFDDDGVLRLTIVPPNAAIRVMSLDLETDVALLPLHLAPFQNVQSVQVTLVPPVPNRDESELGQMPSPNVILSNISDLTIILGRLSIGTTSEMLEEGEEHHETQVPEKDWAGEIIDARSEYWDEGIDGKGIDAEFTDSESDSSDDSNDPLHTNQLFDSFTFPALKSISLSVSVDNLDSYWWPHDSFTQFVHRSSLGNTLRELSLSDVYISEQDLLDVFRLIPSVSDILVSPQTDDPESWPFPVTPHLIRQVINKTNEESILPNLTTLSVWVWRSRQDPTSVSEVLVALAELVHARSTLQGLHILSHLETEGESERMAGLALRDAVAKNGVRMSGIHLEG